MMNAKQYRLFHVKHFMAKKYMRYILIWLSVTASGYFLCNLGMRYANIGSFTGAALSLLVTWYAFAPDQWTRAIRKLKEHKTGRAVLKTIIAFAGLILVLAVVTTVYILRGYPAEAPGPGRTVIILGSGVNDDGTPTRITKARADAAIPYILENPDSAVITSGGLYTDDRITEAESMKRYLSSCGIESGRIFTESRSTSTAQNLRNSAVIIRENNLNTKVVIATSEFHAARSDLYCRRNNLETASLRAKTEWWVWPTCMIREMYGILDAWIIHRR